MTHARWAFAALALVACSTASVRPEAAIRAQYQRIEETFARQRFERLPDFFAPDFEGRRGDAPAMTRDAFLRAMDWETRRMLPPIEVALRPEIVEISAGAARVRIDEDTRYRVRTADGSMHELHYRQRYEDHWRRYGDAWLVRETLYPGPPYESFFDGKATPMAEIGRLLGR